MAKTEKRKRAKRVEAKEEKKIKEAAAEVTRPGAEEKGVEEARESAAEIPQKEAAPEERPPLKQTILTQCMKDPSFRRRVIYHLTKKSR